MNLVQVEKVAKALADKTRLQIYEHIARHPQVTCGQLVELRGVTPATVSHHLKVLSEAGLISCRREGQFVLNQANPRVLEAFTRAVKSLAGRSLK
jgi:ArsR family transcriptional regulator